ncbi:unnamed protein product, partial [Prorocentrum cordatum]
MRVTKLAPDVIYLSYSAGISACKKGEQWQRVLSLLTEMRGAKVDPDVIAYSAGISACEKGEQWQRALALLREMREVWLEPNPWSATALGSARAKKASSGSGLWRCSVGCGRRSWSLTSQLQRRNQRVREGRAVAASARAAPRDAGGAAGAQPDLQLQCCGQRVRERQAVAAGGGAAQRDVGSEGRAQ